MASSPDLATGLMVAPNKFIVALGKSLVLRLLLIMWRVDVGGTYTVVLSELGDTALGGVTGLSVGDFVIVIVGVTAAAAPVFDDNDDVG